jgi:predicted transposase/invertase (TIGR01784 family)
MKTDSIFYRLFLELPGVYFQLIGQSPNMADYYEFRSVEIKQTAFRLDGVLIPKTESPTTPVRFCEVQMQKDTTFYRRFFAEIFLYLYREHLNARINPKFERF